MSINYRVIHGAIIGGNKAKVMRNGILFTNSGGNANYFPGSGTVIVEPNSVFS